METWGGGLLKILDFGYFALIRGQTDKKQEILKYGVELQFGQNCQLFD